MLNKDKQFGRLEQDIKNNMPIANLDIFKKFSAAVRPASAINDSMNEINNADINSSNSNTNDKVRVRAMPNQFTSQSSNISTPEPQQTVNSVYNGPSAFNTAPQNSGMYDFIERGGYSGTFILIAGIVLMIITFLVTFMVLTYFNI